MWSFLTDLARNPGTTYTVVLMEREGVDQARQYELQPKRLAVTWALSVLVVVLLAVSLMAFTPARQFIPGYGTDELRQNARMNMIRVQALQDSLAVQRHYVDRLQQLMTGRVDSVAQGEVNEEPLARSEGEAAGEVPSPREPSSDDWEDHRQPAVSVSNAPTSGSASAAPSTSGFVDRTG